MKYNMIVVDKSILVMIKIYLTTGNIIVRTDLAIAACTDGHGINSLPPMISNCKLHATTSFDYRHTNTVATLL